MKFYWDRQSEVWVEASRFSRPPSVFPAIHRDYMDPATHPSNGVTTDSKSTFRRATKAAGMIEMGTDAPRERGEPVRDPITKADIAEAWEMVEQGYRPEPDRAAPELQSLDTRVYA